MGDSSESKDDQEIYDEEEPSEQPVISTGLKEYKSKLDTNHLALFGFTTAAQTTQDKGDGRGGYHGPVAKGTKSAAKRNRNDTVVYGADDDDVGYDDDYDQDQDYPADYDSDASEEDEDEDAEDEESGKDKSYYKAYFDNQEYDADNMWEDEEELGLGEGEDAEDALLAEEMEKARLREERVAEIMMKKESLIQRYLKIARVMIAHRKKNIYLQDYLYHLALRKGILRGDEGANTDAEDDPNTLVLTKAQKRRQKKKNTAMAARFARFLRKTGHLFDEDEIMEHTHHHHHHHHMHHHHHHHHHHLAHPHHHHHHHHHGQYPPSTRILKGGGKVCYGKNCSMSRAGRAHLHRKLKMMSDKKNLHDHADAGAKRKEVGNPQPTLRERLEKKAAATLKTAMTVIANKALNDYERHRCKLVRRKQIVKISTLLERQYKGTTLLDKERSHLITFVEHSVTAQNLAKRKAARHRMKPEKTGVTTNMNHQWIKSLERIRELRIRKSKLEQDHRLQLLRKVRHWHVWEKRTLLAVDAVQDFITKMASRVIMTKRETESFKIGLDQFSRQLQTLHNAMQIQLVKMYKTRTSLFMAERKIKDNASVASMKGFSIADYERMILENKEAHDKLVERQVQLVKGHTKLRNYVKQVANSHLRKQATWGALRAGRHDVKALLEMCTVERSNLLKKLKEMKKASRLHGRLFMQISILENKKCFGDYQRVRHRVQELKDKKRLLQTQLHQDMSLLRVLNVKVEDIQERVGLHGQEKLDKVQEEGLAYCRATVHQRIDPRPPVTIYDMNISGGKKTSTSKCSKSCNKGLPKSDHNKLPPI